MDFPTYLRDTDSTLTGEENYQEELNQTLLENLGLNGFVITSISATDLTVTPILNPNTGTLTTVGAYMPNGTHWYVSDIVLGVMSVLGTGVLAVTELLINGIDLAGTYTTPLALVNYINTGVVSGVSAQLAGTNFVLTSSTGDVITLSTAGTVGANGLTFANFSTTGGSLTTVFMGQLVGKLSGVLQKYPTLAYP